MRRSSSTRYDVQTSAEAWSLIGTLDAHEFSAVQAEIEKLAWSAFSLKAANSGSTRMNVTVDRVGMMFEIDHVSGRVTLLSLSRGMGGRNRLLMDPQPTTAPEEAPEPPRFSAPKNPEGEEST